MPKYLCRSSLTLVHHPQRVLSVSGVADAIHIAVYYIGTILQEHPVASVSNTSYRPSGGAQGYGGGGGDYGRGGGGGYGAPPPRGPPAPTVGPGAQTQQIFIPNELVGTSLSPFRSFASPSVQAC
jgi:heterogeneous nuclear rnp K-like protein